MAAALIIVLPIVILFVMPATPLPSKAWPAGSVKG